MAPHATPHRHGMPHVGTCPGCQRLAAQRQRAHVVASASAAHRWAARLAAARVAPGPRGYGGAAGSGQ